MSKAHICKIICCNVYTGHIHEKTFECPASQHSQNFTTMCVADVPCSECRKWPEGDKWPVIDHKRECVEA